MMRIVKRRCSAEDSRTYMKRCLAEDSRTYICLAIVLLIAPSIMADDYVHQFGKDTLGEAAFVVNFERSDKFYSTNSDGLRLRWREADGVMKSTGVKTVFALSGDFDIEWLFTIRSLSKPDTGNGNGVQISVGFRDSEESRLSVARACAANRKQVLKVNHSREHLTKHDVKTYDVPQDLRGVRIERRNGLASVFCIQSKGKTLLREVKVGGSEVFPVGIWANTGGGKANLDVTLQKLSVTGAGLPIGSKVPSAPVPFWVWVVGTGAGGLMFGLAGLIFRQFRSKEMR